jgi:hypothetical protein
MLLHTGTAKQVPPAQVCHTRQSRRPAHRMAWRRPQPPASWQARRLKAVLVKVGQQALANGGWPQVVRITRLLQRGRVCHV